MELLTTPMNIVGWISQPWHWAVSGAAIAGILFLMTWLGRSFGVSTTFKTWCTMMGAGKRFSFFKIDLKSEGWRIAFVIGAVIGGVITANLLQSPEPVAISEATQTHLADWDIEYPQTIEEGVGMVPTDVFNFSNPLGIVLSIVGGFLIGFGARYARGCTSGHAITGMAHLQLPSLLTVIGFFIGGLIMTHLLMPLIFG
jgi:uncharacterized membrane protein YedE/YeeE